MTSDRNYWKNLANGKMQRTTISFSIKSSTQSSSYSLTLPSDPKYTYCMAYSSRHYIRDMCIIVNGIGSSSNSSFSNSASTSVSVTCSINRTTLIVSTSTWNGMSGTVHIFY